MKTFFDRAIKPLSDDLARLLKRDTSKRITVTYLPSTYWFAVKKRITCTGQGHAKCVKDGEHSWFNHSMDSYFNAPYRDNYPQNYREEF